MNQIVRSTLEYLWELRSVQEEWDEIFATGQPIENSERMTANAVDEKIAQLEENLTFYEIGVQDGAKSYSEQRQRKVWGKYNGR